MCGRYAFFDTEKLYERFGVKQQAKGLAPRYNVAPGSVMPTVVRHSPPSIQLMKWGLIPSWAKDPKIGYRMINARGETVATKPAFRKPFLHQRCLIPANGFYEWDRKGSHKTPYFFSLKSRPIMAMAGLYDKWKDAEGREIYSYTIITTQANGVVGRVHVRMPVILAQTDEAVWIDPENQSAETLTPLLKPYPDNDLAAVEVSEAVNTPANDAPEVLRPMTE